MYKAKFDSYNFTFEAYAETKALALEHLKKGLQTHAQDYDLDPDWWHDLKNDIYAIEIKPPYWFSDVYVESWWADSEVT
jgi:hypothetical protein